MRHVLHKLHRSSRSICYLIYSTSCIRIFIFFYIYCSIGLERRICPRGKGKTVVEEATESSQERSKKYYQDLTRRNRWETWFQAKSRRFKGKRAVIHVFFLLVFHCFLLLLGGTLISDRRTVCFLACVSDFTCPWPFGWVGVCCGRSVWGCVGWGGWVNNGGLL